jgi:hypothetical protein
MVIQIGKNKGELVCNRCEESFAMSARWMSLFEKKAGSEATFFL